VVKEDVLKRLRAAKECPFDRKYDLGSRKMGEEPKPVASWGSATHNNGHQTVFRKEGGGRFGGAGARGKSREPLK